MELEANIVKSRKQGHTSFLKTVFNGLNAVIGVGILSMPYALASGGWLSLVFLIIISMGACYGGFLTQRCMEENPKIETYYDIGEYAFGKIGKIIVSIILYVDLYLVLTGYLILEGDNLHSLFPRMKIEVFGSVIGGKACFVIIIALLLLPTVWLEDVRLLAYISAAGVLAALLILVSVLWVGVFDGVGFHNKGQLINWRGLPTALSLYMFSYSANPIFPTLYNSMHKKRNFSKVLVISFMIATFCYTSMAILGYMMYGSTLNSQITLNLPTQKISSKIAIYIAWITPLSKYALMMEPVASTTESWLPNKYQKKKSVKMLLRTLLVASQVIVALSIPFFGALMSLVGALLSATASITVPCLCYLKISKTSPKSIQGVVIMVLIALSILLVVVGTYTSLFSIVKDVSTQRY